MNQQAKKLQAMKAAATKPSKTHAMEFWKDKSESVKHAKMAASVLIAQTEKKG